MGLVSHLFIFFGGGGSVYWFWDGRWNLVFGSMEIRTPDIMCAKMLSRIGIKTFVSLNLWWSSFLQLFSAPVPRHCRWSPTLLGKKKTYDMWDHFSGQLESAGIHKTLWCVTMFIITLGLSFMSIWWNPVYTSMTVIWIATLRTNIASSIYGIGYQSWLVYVLSALKFPHILDWSISLSYHPWKPQKISYLSLWTGIVS